MQRCFSPSPWREDASAWRSAALDARVEERGAVSRWTTTSRARWFLVGPHGEGSTALITVER
jgi:hypothetical protein